MMNVLSNSIKDYMTLQIKGCKEIQFSHGGHMFACSVPPNGVHIYNFYTADCPTNMQCKGSSIVRGIEWFENDMGLVTAAKDGTCYFYDLLNVKENAG
jgi:WD40 repeat protein